MLFASVLLSQSASPQERPDDREARRYDAPGADVRREDLGLLGEFIHLWEHLKAAAADEGVSLEVLLTLDASQHVAGGADEGAGAVRELVDLIAAVDTPAIGGELVAHLEGLAGDDASARLGLAQAYSNIDAADDRVQLAKLWWRRDYDGALAWLGVGKVDANELFAYVESGSPFLHSSMGYSPTVLDFPTYPDPAFGVACALRGPGETELRLGLFDGAFHVGRRTGVHGPSTVFGAPTDLFAIAELGAAWPTQAEPHGRACVGAWRQTGDFARFDGGFEEGAEGVYSTYEQRLPANGERPALEWFLQLGWADPAVSPFERHVGAGIVVVHPFAERVDDRIGVGLSSVRLSDEPAAGFTRDSETAYELFYSFEPEPGVRLKPDVQLIDSPGGDATLDDAWVVTLRVSLSF